MHSQVPVCQSLIGNTHARTFTLLSGHAIKFGRATTKTLSLRHSVCSSVPSSASSSPMNQCISGADELSFPPLDVFLLTVCPAYLEASRLPGLGPYGVVVSVAFLVCLMMISFTSDVDQIPSSCPWHIRSG